MKIAFASPSFPSSGALVVGVLAGKKLTPSAAELDEATGGALARAMAASRFTGQAAELLEVVGPANVGNGRILLAGLGKASACTALAAEKLGGAICARLLTSGESDLAVRLDEIKDAEADLATFAAHVAYGLRLRSYRFDKYRTQEKSEKKPSLKSVKILSSASAGAKKRFAQLDKIAAGVFTTRDVVSEPANIIYPKSFVAEAKKLGKLGVKIQVLGEKEMAKLGMGALLGVGQGSDRESQLLIMRWEGAPRAKNKRPIAFVGKGVTFDTGGISIKPAAGMEDMKWDMGGAGVVLGLMHALAGRKAKVNAIGVCGLVENMPSSKAQRPGDIVTSMSGQTIEVLNTDAEGRLVLADALWYVQEKYKPAQHRRSGHPDRGDHHFTWP